jgi:hypothetical protein
MGCGCITWGVVACARGSGGRKVSVVRDVYGCRKMHGCGLYALGVVLEHAEGEATARQPWRAYSWQHGEQCGLCCVALAHAGLSLTAGFFGPDVPGSG